MSRDTPPDVEARFDALLAARSGPERVRMMSEMFDTARALVLADLRRSRGLMTEGETRQALFERLYYDDFDDEERHRILERLGDRAVPRD